MEITLKGLFMQGQYDYNAEQHFTTMSEAEFCRLSEFIYNECGIKLPDAKKTMLEARLMKRLRALGFRSYAEYFDYLFSPDGIENELINMIDVVTTNKTDFFREPDHFNYLVKTALPDLIKDYGAGVKRNLLVWSAGCSTGEEPYTLAIVLSEFAEKYKGLGFKFLILASDISTRVLDIAQRGIYAEEKVSPIPIELRRKYLLKSRDKNKGLVRVVPELRSMVKFRRVNFMEGDFGMREQIDIIFCRNVIIYFDKTTQKTVLTRLANHLMPGGYLFIGHSESLSGIDLPLMQTSPTIYRKLA